MDLGRVRQVAFEPPRARKVADLPAEHLYQSLHAGLHGQHPDLRDGPHVGPVSRTARELPLQRFVTLVQPLLRRFLVQVRPFPQVHPMLIR